jgi:hypothetical protein
VIRALATSGTDVVGRATVVVVLVVVVVVVGWVVVVDDVVVVVGPPAELEQATTKTSSAVRIDLIPAKGQDRRRDILSRCSALSMVSGWHWSVLPSSPPLPH